ncbi:MAG: hypothetical protein R2761_16985 [Acidimicrobiales bacterium]
MSGQKYTKPALQTHGSVASLTLGKPGSDLGAPGMGMTMTMTMTMNMRSN